jgi:hypothetical protein
MKLLGGGIFTPYLMGLKLCQAQIWQRDGEFIRIVKLDRLTVHYKVATTLKAGAGTHHQCSKKEFCRLIKTASLLPPTSPV